MTEVTLGLTAPFAHGRGFSEPLALPDPAVSTGFTITIGSQYWERGAALAFRLVTDSNAANRAVKLVVNGGDCVALATLPAASVQTATLTWDYTWTPDVSTFNTVAALSVVSPFPHFFLQPEYSLVVTIGAKQVGDQISNIRFYRERFQTGPGGYQQGTVTDLEARALALARLVEYLK